MSILKQMSAKELMGAYIYREALNQGLTSKEKTSHESLTAEDLKQELLDRCKSIESFNEIKKTLFQNPWLPLFFEVAGYQQWYFQKFFSDNYDFFWERIRSKMFLVMIETNSNEEETYLGYTDQDIEYTLNGTKRVTGYWISRNYYKAIKNARPGMAEQILSITQEDIFLYKTIDLPLLDNCRNEFSLTFRSLKTDYAKLALIDLIWSKANYSNKVSFSPLIEVKDQLFEIFEMCLRSENKSLIVNITLVFYAIFAVKSSRSEVEEIKNNFLKITKKHNDELFTEACRFFKIN